MHVVKGCSVEGCGRAHKAKGYCQTHYRRLQRNGSAEDTPGCAGTPLERLLRRTVRDMRTGCLEWQGCVNGDGYGVIKTEATATDLTHRVVAAAEFGADALTRLYVCHRCDNPKCVEIKHLFLGTSQDNAIDRESKGRGIKLFGDANPNSKYMRAKRAS